MVVVLLAFYIMLMRWQYFDSSLTAVLLLTLLLFIALTVSCDHCCVLCVYFVGVKARAAAIEAAQLNEHS